MSSTVEVLPLEPVTAMICSGTSTCRRISGHNISASLPGRVLPLPISPPKKLPTLHNRMAKHFLISMPLSIVSFGQKQAARPMVL